MTNAPVPLSTTLLRGLACKCPRCGEGGLFEGFLSLRPSCSACGLDYAFIDAGDGPAVFIILIAGFIVAVLLALGVWQLERRVDKLALIAALDERLAAAPVVLPPSGRWQELTPAKDEFRRVTLSGIIDPRDQAQVFASPSQLRKDIAGTGTWAFAPVKLAGGETVVVNRGFVGDGQDVRQGASGPVALIGYIRFPEVSGWLTPHADRTKRLWFVRDHLAMAQALGWAEPQRLAPFYIDLEGPTPPGGIPKPGRLQVNLKNDHLQYAVTWFLLAAAVTIAFGFWLHGARRPPSAPPVSL